MSSAKTGKQRHAVRGRQHRRSPIGTHARHRGCHRPRPTDLRYVPRRRLGTSVCLRVDAEPVFGDIDTPHECYPVLFQGVLDEVPHGGCTVRMSAPTRMETDGHHSFTVSMFGLVNEIIEPELQALEKMPGRRVSGWNEVASVVVHLRVWHDKESCGPNRREVRELVVDRS